MKRALPALLLLIVLPCAGLAQAPAFLPLQGVLTDASGTPLNGTVDQVVFSVYTAAQGGDLVWSEPRSLEVDQGVFTVYLGEASDLVLSWFREHPTLWLGIKVADDPEMSRILLGSVPYAAYAEYTSPGTLESLSCAAGQVAKWNGTDWACADDLNQTAVSMEFSEEFLVSAGPANCSSGCINTVELGNWSYCSLSRNEARVYDNHTDSNNDVWNCYLTGNSGTNWQLTARYNSHGNAAPLGFTNCGARCFRTQ